MGNEHGELAVEANTLADIVSKGPRGADPVAPGRTCSTSTWRRGVPSEVSGLW